MIDTVDVRKGAGDEDAGFRRTCRHSKNRRLHDDQRAGTLEHVLLIWKRPSTPSLAFLDACAPRTPVERSETDEQNHPVEPDRRSFYGHSPIGGLAGSGFRLW